MAFGQICSTTLAHSPVLKTVAQISAEKLNVDDVKEGQNILYLSSSLIRLAYSCL